ncbi:MAG: protein phosphatase 2C domain-containing protein [Polyangiaceae bacterium]|jgi:PPM family protein phosphatase
MTTDGVGLEVYGRTDVGRVRANNEDAFVIADLMAPTWTHAMREPVELSVGARGVLLAVSDGMGGAQAGEVASALTLHALRRGMVTVEASGAEAALTASVERANQKVWDAGTASGQKGMGATLTAVLLHGKRAYVAEVGDSRAYVLRGSRLIRLTHDQSCAQLMLDAGALTREEAETFQYKNMVLQAIGVKPHVIVALNRFTLRRGDKVLLCSDGLTGKVTDDEIRDILLSTPAMDAACARLVELANHRGGEDNITVIVAVMDGEGLPAFSGEERISLETVQAFTG